MAGCPKGSVISIKKMAQLAENLPVTHIYAFAREILDMDDVSLTNTDNSRAATVYDKFYTALKVWKKKCHKANLNQLKELLYKARSRSIEYTKIIEIMEKFEDTDSLTPQKLSVIARRLPESEMEYFYSGVLGLEESDCNLETKPDSEQAVNRVLSVLQCWRDVHGPNATEEALKKLLQEGVKLEFFDDSIIHTYETICKHGTVAPDDIGTEKKVSTRCKAYYKRELKYIKLLWWDANSKQKTRTDSYYELSAREMDENGAPKTGSRDVLVHMLIGPKQTSEYSYHTNNLTLLEGQPGSGKSCFLSTIAYNWACGDEKLKGYTQLFLINLKDMSRAESFSEYICQHILVSECSSQQLDCIIKSTQEKILLLLDGYDEMPEPNENLNYLLKNRLDGKLEVVITSRPESITGELRSYSSSYYKLKSLESDEKIPFVQKLYGEAATRWLMIDDIDHHPLEPLLSTPLFLAILCILHEQDQLLNIQEISSRTLLFKYVIQRILTVTKKRLFQNDDFIRKSMSKLEEATYQSACNNKTCIEKISTAEVSLGLIELSYQPSGIEYVPVYRFYHGTLMEYTIAKYVTRSKSDQDLLAVLGELPVMKEEQKLKSSMLPVFICGMLSKQKRHQAIIEVLKKYVKDTVDTKSKWHSKCHLGLQCLAECSYFDGMQEILQDLCPQTVVLDCSQYCMRGLLLLLKPSSKPNTTKLHLETLEISSTFCLQVTMTS